jgi:hypothetical protein
MKRRGRAAEPAVNTQASGIPPWIDNFGRPVWNNPWGQYRPNTQGLPAEPVATVAAPEPVVTPTVEEAPVPAQQAVGYPTVLPTAPNPRAAYDALLESGEFDRIRGTLQYAKGYAKACKELGLEVPEELKVRLRDEVAARRSRVHKRVRRTVAAAAAVSAGAVGMNAAAAYFTSTGSGSGSGSVGSVAAVSVTAGTSTSPLFPGGSGDVALTINNPNSFPLTLKSVSGNGAITADGGHPGCSTTGVSFTNQSGLTNTLAPGNNSIDFTSAASMSAASDSGCQGATFTIPVVVTVQTP